MRFLLTLLVAWLAGLPAQADPQAPPPDILQAAQAAGHYTTLLALLKNAGMLDQLRGSGPWTLFAPTDEAFAKLPVATLDQLAKSDDKDALKRLLGAHVVPARVTAASLKGKQVTLKRLAGPDLSLDGRDGLTAGGVPVAGGEIVASNGVLEPLDQVLPAP